MTDMEIIKLVFGTLLSLGAVVLFFLSFKLFYKYLIQEKRCTSKVTGVVKNILCSDVAANEAAHSYQLFIML